MPPLPGVAQLPVSQTVSSFWQHQPELCKCFLDWLVLPEYERRFCGDASRGHAQLLLA